MTQLELNKVFDEADSDILNNNEKVCVENILYKSNIEVNERGLSLVTIPTLDIAFQTPIQHNITLEFKCNKPFMFLIHSKKEIFFIGKLMRPDYI